MQKFSRPTTICFLLRNMVNKKESILGNKISGDKEEGRVLKILMAHLYVLCLSS